MVRIARHSSMETLGDKSSYLQNLLTMFLEDSLSESYVLKYMNNFLKQFKQITKNLLTVFLKSVCTKVCQCDLTKEMQSKITQICTVQIQSYKNTIIILKLDDCMMLIASNNLIPNFILIKDKTLLCHLRLRENSTRYLFHRSFLTFISFQFHKIVCNFSSNYHLSDSCVFSNLSTSTLCHAIDN